MTKEDALRFAELQMEWLRFVHANDTSMQRILIEQILTWIEERIQKDVATAMGSLGTDLVKQYPLPTLKPEQRNKFISMQVVLLHLAVAGDMGGIDTMEREMRAWIDIQCEEATGRATGSVVKAKMKVTEIPTLGEEQKQ